MHSAYVPLYPLFALAAYFIVALGLFSLRARWVGIAVDAEVASRPASKLLGRYLRHYIMWVLGEIRAAAPCSSSARTAR